MRLLTDDSEHAGRLGGPGVTFVLRLIVEHRLVDDEDPLDSLSDDLVLLSFPDLATVFEPTNLHNNMRVIREIIFCHLSIVRQILHIGNIRALSGVYWCLLVFTGLLVSPWQTRETLHIQTWQILSL